MGLRQQLSGNDGWALSGAVKQGLDDGWESGPSGCWGHCTGWVIADEGLNHGEIMSENNMSDGLCQVQYYGSSGLRLGQFCHSSRQRLEYFCHM